MNVTLLVVDTRTCSKQYSDSLIEIRNAFKKLLGYDSSFESHHVHVRSNSGISQVVCRIDLQCSCQKAMLNNTMLNNTVLFNIAFNSIHNQSTWLAQLTISKFYYLLVSLYGFARHVST